MKPIFIYSKGYIYPITYENLNGNHVLHNTGINDLGINRIKKCLIFRSKNMTTAIKLIKKRGYKLALDTMVYRTATPKDINITKYESFRYIKQAI